MFFFFKSKIFIPIFVFLALFPIITLALTKEEQESQWRIELEQTEKDIAKWQSILDSTKANTKSLQQEAAVLNAKIQQAKSFIKQKNIAIARLEVDIAIKNNHIKTLEEKIKTGHDSLAQILRKTNEIDSYSLPEVVLTGKNISDFWSDVDTFDSVDRSLNDLFIDIRATKDLTEKEKTALNIQKNKEADTKAAAEVEKKRVEVNEKEKEYLITINKTHEKTYEQVLTDRKKRASEIRAALFNLRDTVAIPFGEALKYAQEASLKTNVRPAFLLAILTQESNLGKNVGTCNRLEDPPEKHWQNIMPGPIQIAQRLSKRDDQGAYLRIIDDLGLNKDTQPLSCPLTSGGWGGAMGPSQFIPTTWEIYAPKVASNLNKNIVNPWNPEDAFMASAIYLSELGANNGGYTAERNAALKYYAGANWTKKSNSFYGSQVMTKASSIQTTMIDPLNF